MRFSPFFSLVLYLLTGGYAASNPTPPLLIVSLDAFRWDYCELYPDETPTLRRLRSEGASARALVPVFPSNTFPNHYTIVTGLRPARHGVINNSMYDAESGRFFRPSVPTMVSDSRWWGGEPIWVTAERNGRRAACSFWVGSEAEIKGVRPTWWRRFDYSVPFETRREELLGWLQLEPANRPQVITFYFEEANAAGHREGPRSPGVAEAIRTLDAQLASLLQGVAELGIAPNLVVVSDHGMTELRPERCVALDEVIDLSKVQIDFSGPVTGLRPQHGSVEELLDQLGSLPAGAKAFASDDLPADLHLKSHPRLPPVLVFAAPGGWVETRAVLDARLSTTKGEHGYAPSHPDMHGLLVVHGPAFRSGGTVIDAVENVHLYNLFCAVMGLVPAENEGDDRLVRSLLVR